MKLRFLRVRATDCDNTTRLLDLSSDDTRFEYGVYRRHRCERGVARVAVSVSCDHGGRPMGYRVLCALPGSTAPPGRSLGDIYGRRKIFVAGVVLFTAASAWCGVASNIRELIMARGLQGIGGALLVPGSLALISVSFSPQQRGRAIGTWSGFTSITAAIGPVLGGWLTEHASWRWVFFINLPLGLVVAG